MKLRISTPGLVLLVGATGAGKSSFAQREFRETEVVSSDRCRALVADDENDQSATADAFELLHLIVRKRLDRRRLTVVDATSLHTEDRASLLELARRANLPASAFAFALPVEELLRRGASRSDRRVPEATIRKHAELTTLALPRLEQEGYRELYVLGSPEEVQAVSVKRVPLSCMRSWDAGPFDIIGDVHGCHVELLELLDALGYDGLPDAPVPPAGRTALFLGDLVDRGPAAPDVLRLVIGMADAGRALCLPGNHDDKLMRWILGRTVQVAHGLEQTVAQLAGESTEFLHRVAEFIGGLPSHLVLDRGVLVAAHAGMKNSLQGRDSRRVRSFALYGETTGELDEHGRPIRRDWAAHYRGRRAVVYGHTPVVEPAWRNNTINIDTGCVYGGRLSALRWPERELVSVPARRVYYRKVGFTDTAAG